MTAPLVERDRPMVEPEESSLLFSLREQNQRELRLLLAVCVLLVGGVAIAGIQLVRHACAAYTEAARARQDAFEQRQAAEWLRGEVALLEATRNVSSPSLVSPPQPGTPTLPRSDLPRAPLPPRTGKPPRSRDPGPSQPCANQWDPLCDHLP
jgi:hypothetical protein